MGVDNNAKATYPMTVRMDEQTKACVERAAELDHRSQAMWINMRLLGVATKEILAAGEAVPDRPKGARRGGKARAKGRTRRA